MNEQVWLALIVGVPAFILGLLGLWRSTNADRKAERFSSVELIINGLNKHVDELQADNAALRVELRALLRRPR